jgi:hypothetical protein
MKNKSKISLSLLVLGLSVMAYASEYKSPQVGFKDRAAPSKEMKVADIGDHYKVEKDFQANDRQIASEEESDREPSSIVAKEKKKLMDHEAIPEEPKDAPKPWLYRNEPLRNN